MWATAPFDDLIRPSRMLLCLSALQPHRAGTRAAAPVLQQDRATQRLGVAPPGENPMGGYPPPFQGGQQQRGFAQQGYPQQGGYGGGGRGRYGGDGAATPAMAAQAARAAEAAAAAAAAAAARAREMEFEAFQQQPGYPPQQRGASGYPPRQGGASNYPRQGGYGQQRGKAVHSTGCQMKGTADRSFLVAVPV